MRQSPKVDFWRRQLGAEITEIGADRGLTADDKRELAAFVTEQLRR
jgi:hypothetical protein